MVRLLIATGLYPPESGGPATYTKLLEDRLPAKGFTVTVVPFRAVRHLPPVIRHMAYLKKLLDHAYENDLILVQDTVSTGLPAVLAARIAQKPFVVRVPGDYAWEQGVQRWGVTDSIDEFQSRRYRAPVEALRLVQRFVVNSAASLIAPSEYLAKIVRHWLSEDKEIKVIYNGIEIGDASGAREEHLIVSCGRLVPWKGFGDLIEIVARHVDWRLAIVGDGPERRALEARAEKTGVRDRVVFVGQVSNAIARDWFRKAAAFVLNSSYEGLSHALMEAMAEGAPVIATDVGGNPEVVREGTGILIPHSSVSALEAALIELMDDPQRRHELSEAARRRARDFSIEMTVAATAAYLHACIKH